MSVATDYLGPRPLVDLHTAGLKVGQSLSKYKRESGSKTKAESDTLTFNPYAQSF